MYEFVSLVKDWFIPENNSSRRICNVSSKNIFKMFSQDLFKMFSRRLQDVFQDVFNTSSICLYKTFSSRRLQEVLQLRLQEDVLQLCLEDVLKTSWKTKKCYTEDVFSTCSPRRVFTGILHKKFNPDLATYFFKQKIDSCEISLFTF